VKVTARVGAWYARQSMAQVQSPQLGYNTNVRYKDRVFHVQTEDSGVARPHVITHLFADGGRIIKSVKRAYADILDEPDLIARVKKLMQEQHKAPTTPPLASRPPRPRCPRRWRPRPRPSP
jgi:hypothetical protein